MRPKLIVGNWKMNGSRAANAALLDGIVAGLDGAKAAVAVCVPAPYLQQCEDALKGGPVAFKAQIARELRERVWPLVEAGKIRPVIHRVFPLAQAAEAPALMESSAHVGKIMLDVAAA
jgi:NADPH:quinone reductase-like Zn-dependent oxidoreductase